MTSAPIRCAGCKAERPRDDFGVDQSRPGGVARRCKACERDRKRAERSTPEGRRRNAEAVRRHRAKIASQTSAGIAPA